MFFLISVPADAFPDNWKTGSAFRSGLNQKIRFQSTGGLRDDLESLSRNTGIAILLDREIDPAQMISFPERSQPLGQLLDEVAGRLDGLSLIVGSFVYIAPREKVIRYQMLQNVQAYAVSRLPDPLQKDLKKYSGLSWSLLSTPRDTIGVQANNWGWKISNPDAIPHDLWPPKDLPRLAHWEQLTFLLCCMNRTLVFEPTTRTIEVVEIEPGRSLVLKFGKSDSNKISRVIKEKGLKSLQTVTRGSDFFVRGPSRQLLALFDQLHEKRKWDTRVKSGSKDVFDLNTSASRGQILATIAKNQGVELKYDPGLVELLKQKVRVEAKQVTVEELVTKTLKGSGLRFQLDERQLLIIK